MSIKNQIFAEVWHGTVDEVLTVFPEQNVLSEEEIQRRDNFQFEKDQKSFAAAHVLTRNMLSRFADIKPADWCFETGPYGRPEIAKDLMDNPVFFNISHKPDAVCCLVSNIPECGVDLEDNARQVDWGLVAPKVFTTQEMAYSGSEDQRFRNLWCLKEAYMKARGLGFNMDPVSCNMVMDGIEVALEDHPDWQFQLFHIGDLYTIAAAFNSCQKIEVKLKACRELPGAI